MQKFIAAAGIALALGSIPALAQNHPFQVKELEGEAFIQGPSKKKVSVDQRIAEGVTLKGGADAHVTIVHPSRSAAYRLDGPFEVRLSEKRADLTLGGMHLRMNKQSKGANPFRVRTRTATLGVRGTTLYVKPAVTQDEDFLCVCEGKVEVADSLSKKSNSILISTQHHDSPKRIRRGSGEFSTRVSPTDVVEAHNDDQAAHLDSLISNH